MELLFVYGTLTDRNVRKEAIGRDVAGEKGTLAGYRKTFFILGGEAYPNLERGSGRVGGLLLELARKELESLDRYECEYERKRVALESGSRAWAYISRRK